MPDKSERTPLLRDSNAQGDRVRFFSQVGNGAWVQLVFVGLLNLATILSAVEYFYSSDPYTARWGAVVLAYFVIIAMCTDIILQTICRLRNSITLWQSSFVFNVYVHHILTIALLVVVLEKRDTVMFSFLFLGLSAEMNTFFLYLRRVLQRGTTPHYVVNIIFLTSWIGIRCVIFPLGTIFVWYLWAKDGFHLDLWLMGAVSATLLAGVFAMWSHALFFPNNKRSKKVSIFQQPLQASTGQRNAGSHSRNNASNKSSIIETHIIDVKRGA